MYEPATTESDLTESDAWFVYLLRASDCTAFKVGFTCNPLQRLYSFNHRYFEGFDLYQSSLLQLSSCDEAREVEAALKAELGSFRYEAPPWVAEEAGGYTEWFSATYYETAEARLRSYLQTYEGARVLQASDVVHEILKRYAVSFEQWASAQAQLVASPRSFAITPLAARDAARTLLDWLDAYRHFDIPVFADEPRALQFIVEIAGLR